MAFLRAQGNRVHVLHSRRDGHRVVQERLHTFSDLGEAYEVATSDEQWGMLADALDAAIGSPGSIDRERLRCEVLAIVDEHAVQEQGDPLQQTTSQLLRTLRSLQTPLTPAQRRSLSTATSDLLALKGVITEILSRRDDGAEVVEDDEMHWDGHGDAAEDLLDRGLEHYDRGEWDQARESFLTGLKLEPDHVDLLVHAGLIEHVQGNEPLALTLYERAAEVGKWRIDQAIAADPERYVKREDLEQWAVGRRCRLADECPDVDTDKCDDCETSPVNSMTTLYRFTEFRPFFRALTNKAGCLMRLRRWEEAIETLQLCQSYDQLWGVRNMIGECHLCLGDLELAEQWYRDILWPDAFYVRGLILLLLGRREEALRYTLTGLTQNPHIATMLVGREKPEEIRYVGDVLPCRLAASEFVHQHGRLFRKSPGFRAMLRCALDDPTIGALHLELVDAHRRHREDRNYRPPQGLFRHMSGTMEDAFLDEHVPRLLSAISNPSSEHWIPEDDAVIEATIVEKKTANWLMCLAGNPDRTFYLRAGSTRPLAVEGETVRIHISKWWHYRRRLFVTGETTRVPEGSAVRR